MDGREIFLMITEFPEIEMTTSLLEILFSSKSEADGLDHGGRIDDGSFDDGVVGKRFIADPGDLVGFLVRPFSGP